MNPFKKGDVVEIVESNIKKHMGLTGAITHMGVNICSVETKKYGAIAFHYKRLKLYREDNEI